MTGKEIFQQIILKHPVLETSLTPKLPYDISGRGFGVETIYVRPDSWFDENQNDLMNLLPLVIQVTPDQMINMIKGLQSLEATRLRTPSEMIELVNNLILEKTFNFEYSSLSERIYDFLRDTLQDQNPRKEKIIELIAIRKNLRSSEYKLINDKIIAEGKLKEYENDLITGVYKNSGGFLTDILRAEGVTGYLLGETDQVIQHNSSLLLEHQNQKIGKIRNTITDTRGRITEINSLILLFQNTPLTLVEIEQDLFSFLFPELSPLPSPPKAPSIIPSGFSTVSA